MTVRRALSRSFAAYLALAARRPGALLLSFLLLGLLCLVPVSGLELRTDLAELLPDDHPGVVAMRRVQPRQISSTNLVILVASPDPQRNRAFVEALRPELGRLVPQVFSEIQYRPETEVPAFFSTWRFLYADKADLVAAEELLDRVIARRSSPLLVDLEDDAEAALKALRGRLEQRLPAVTEAPYFEARDPRSGAHYTGVMLWRRSAGLATLDDQQTLSLVEDTVARVDPRRFHPAMKVEYSGAIAAALDEHKAVRDDLTWATSACLLLVLGAIYLYFRRLAVLAVVGAPALLGVVLSLCLARYTLHHLNANTAFLISIILGNGINTPIILLGRFGEERRAGLPPEAALSRALRETAPATLAAAAAASLAYGSLLLTSLRGLSQFGLVGGAGMLLSWLMTYLLVPPLVLFGEGRRPGALSAPPSSLRPALLRAGRLAERSPRALGALLLVATGAAALPAYRYLRDPLEYDLDRLRTASPDTARRWQIMYDLGMGNVGAGHIARDGVVLVDRAEEADVVADALRRQDRARGAGSLLETVRTLNSMLPSEQEEKLELLGRLRRKLDRHRGLMSDDEAREAARWRPPESLHALTVAELPRRIRENFTEVDGTVGRLVGIDADPRRFVESDGRELIRLARAMEVEALGRRFVAASAATVFAGMIETIIRDTPRVTAASVLGVVGLIALSFGAWWGLPVLGSLLLGLGWLLGLLGALSLKLNFVNFVAIPITLGIGTDYAANLWARVRREPARPLGEILADTGSAVALCSLTTIIGYSSLLLARNRALQSFGLVADLGEVLCLAAALGALPPLHRWLARRRAA